MAGEEALERRIVTVLFADLVGFTSLSEQYDPEDVAAIQDRYFAAVRDTIARYGGRLEKFIGDAAMAVFGVPRSRDDDAERAVRAGQALIHAVQQLGAQLGLDEEVLRLRVGVNTGEAVIAAAGQDEGRVTGDTVNTAARLQTAAPAGGVLVGPTTALAVNDVAILEHSISLDLKGKAQPLAARVLAGFRPEASREQAMGELRAPTVGREAELERLTAALAEAKQGSSLRRVIVAPPGVGKSRLVRELADGAQRDAAVAIWRSRARPDSSSVFEPIAGLLLSALGGAASERRAAETVLSARLAAAHLTDMRAEVVARAALGLLWPEELTAAESHPAEEREARFGAWLDALDSLAGGRTQLWLVEDIHWVGGDVLAFLQLAAERETSHGRLAVVTARPSLRETSPGWAEAGEVVLELSTLAPTDASALVEALVGDALPESLVGQIAERSDGNCLFIEELLRSWVSVGTLVRDQSTDEWRLAVRAEEVPLPASVQSIYAAQIDDLPPDARRVARRASVAGRRFPVRALQTLDADESGLEPLKRRALLAGPEPEPLLGDAFAYRHALLRDAGYASLARAERARLHVRLARWLEEAAGDRQGELAEQIASHYSSALESAPALATEVDEGLDRATVRRLAAEWYERAGEATLSVSAHEAARALLKRSIQLTPQESHLEQARRWERLGNATAFAADMDEGAVAYQKAIEFYRAAMTAGSAAFDRGSATLDAMADGMERRAEELHSRLDVLGERLGIPDLGKGMSRMSDSASELRAGAKQIQEDKRKFERDMAAAGLARATSELANVWYQQLRFDEARDLAEATLNELDDIDDASRARLLLARGHASVGAFGRSGEAENDLEQAVELARRGGDAYAELRALNVLAAMRGEAGEAIDADAWRQIENRARELGKWSVAATASMNYALTVGELRPRELPVLIQPARELAAAHGATDDVAWTWYFESEAHFQTGEWDRALAAGRAAMDIGEANAYLRVTVRAVHVMVPIASARADMAMLERAAKFYASIDGKFEAPDSPYARVMRPAQDLDLAAAGLARPYVPEVGPRVAAFAEQPLGASWSSALDRIFRSWIEAGDMEGASRALAAMAAARHGWSDKDGLGAGTFELLSGRLALARGDRDTATRAASRAISLFRTADAPWWVAKAIRLLQRTGAADYELLSDVFEIERRLGATRPTA